MTTVINNPGGSAEGSGMGMIVGVLVAILVIVLFFVYGLPALRGNRAADNGNGGIDINVTTPSGNGGATSGGTTY